MTIRACSTIMLVFLVMRMMYYLVSLACVFVVILAVGSNAPMCRTDNVTHVR